MPEIKYEITEHLGVISETARGWTREVNMISWNGIDNFLRLYKEITTKDSMLQMAVKNTAIFVVLVVPLQILLALGLALFTNNKRPGTTFFKVCSHIMKCSQ